MVIKTAIVFSLVCISAMASDMCQFYKFPAQPFLGKSSKLKLDNEFSKAFKTNLSEGLSEKADFAGSLNVVIWGCGTGCIGGGIVDHKTGQAQEFPFILFKSPLGLPSPLLYRPDSRLLIATGTFSEEEEIPTTRCYYWTNTRLKLLQKCDCKPIPLNDMNLDRVQQEINQCGQENHTERSFSECLLKASRNDIESLRKSVEAVDGIWTMQMDKSDEELVSHFLHTSAIMYKLPPDFSDSMIEREISEWVDATMWMVDHREKLRNDPNIFISSQPAVPVSGSLSSGKPIR